MNACKRYRNLIASYVDGTATEEERASLQHHMGECRACGREVEELRRTRALLTDLPALRPPPRLAPAISARLRQERRRWLERLWWQVRPADWRLPAVATLLLILCVGAGLVALRPPATTPDYFEHQQRVATVYRPPAAAAIELPADDYLSSCVLIHENFDENRAFGPSDDVELVSYGP
jgi:anti-sigma factor RsiW